MNHLVVIIESRDIHRYRTVGDGDGGRNDTYIQMIQLDIAAKYFQVGSNRLDGNDFRVRIFAGEENAGEPGIRAQVQNRFRRGWQSKVVIAMAEYFAEDKSIRAAIVAHDNIYVPNRSRVA